MTRVTFDYDQTTTVPLPGGDLEPHDIDRWASEAAQQLATHHGFTATAEHALALALARAQRSATSDPATNLLLHEPGTGAWAPLRLTLADWEPDAGEQRRYLAPPSILAPRIRLAPTEGLGMGCSSTVSTSDGAAEVRWLFVTPRTSFFARLGPIAPPVVAMIAARVEDLLNTVRIDGDVWSLSESFDPGALARLAPDAEISWRI